MTPYLRPRRSMLYVPACAPRFLNKARTLKVDSVILDLGDSVLVENKVSSRDQVVDALLQGGFGRREKVVNSRRWLATRWLNTWISPPAR